MRIAQVSPLYESVPPKLYGGTERIVWALTEELVKLGHDVTLYASGDSNTSAKLNASCAQALRLSGFDDKLTPHFKMFDRLIRESDRYDLVHFHTEVLHFPMTDSLQVPHVSTMHGRLDLPEYQGVFSKYQHVPLVSISEHQRVDLPAMNWRRTIHHGLSSEHLQFSERPGKYLAFLGRISREKRVDRAIEIARRTGWKIKIAAKVDREIDGEYIDEVAPLLTLPHVEFIGEIGESEKSEFLRGAAATLFPIDWPEPFGLVMIESMAVGTPVIAFGCGSVPEIINNGVSGFVVQTLDAACEAVECLSRIDRHDCRRDFEKRFSIQRMVEDYLKVYRDVEHAAPMEEIGDGQEARGRATV